jgi:hydrogenase expression/formation protein HypC
MCLAVPGELLDCQGDDPLTRTGTVRFGGVEREVALAFVPEATPGDWVIVHVGVAISTLDEEEAQRALEALDEALSA